MLMVKEYTPNIGLRRGKPSCILKRMSEDHGCCRHEGKKPAPWYKTVLFWAGAAAAVLFTASFFFPKLQHFRHSFAEYLKMMVVPVGLGFLAGGILDYYIPQEYVSKHLARNKKRTVFYAAGLGFLMSACSHGILALSMELHKKGASGPAVISFLLASPWANLPITFLLIGFFGLKAFVIILSALVVAIVTGLVFLLLDEKGLIEKNRHTVATAPDFSIRKDVMRRLREYRFSPASLGAAARGITRGMASLADMVLGWVLIGVVLASFMSSIIPPDAFQNWFGPSLAGLLLTLAMAAVLEVCSEGTAPVVFEIYKHTGAFGNAFAFLMGGVVTDYTEIGLIWSSLGKKTALWMVAVCIPQVILIAWVLNILF